jgi:hypothetical protein
MAPAKFSNTVEPDMNTYWTHILRVCTGVAVFSVMGACTHTEPQNSPNSAVSEAMPEILWNARYYFQANMQSWELMRDGSAFNSYYFGTDGPLSVELEAMSYGQSALRIPVDYSVVCVACLDPDQCTVTVDIRFDDDVKTSLRAYEMRKVGFLGLYREAILKDTPKERRRLNQCKKDNELMFKIRDERVRRELELAVKDAPKQAE